MGQKSNPIALRSNLKNYIDFSRFIEKNRKDSTHIIHQDLEIRKYINRFFNLHGLILVNCLINRYHNNLELIISYFTTINSIKLIKNKNISLSKHKSKKKHIQTNKRLIKKRAFSVLKRKKFFFNKRVKKVIIFKKISFFNKLLASLNLFLLHRYNIKIILQNVNKSLSFRLKNKEAYLYRKVISKLRFYSRSSFFSESINILLLFTKKKNMSKLLIEFISLNLSVLKRHNFFLTFIRRALIIFLNTKYSLVRGLKIRISGRFNGAARSKTRVFQIKKIPLQTLHSNINYNQSTSFTNNGTFGIKLWVYTK